MRAFWSFCAIASFSAALGCQKSGAGAGAGTDAGAGAGTDAGVGAGADAGVAVDASAAIPDPYLTAQAISAKSIGHTSYVLKVTLEGGAKAAFKPRSRLPLGDRRYKGEIAAYRLALALGIDNVPRAIPRTLDAAPLRGADDFAGKAIVDADGHVRGALIPWIEKYKVLPLEEPSWRAKWEGWLMDAGGPAEGDRELAGAISTMIVFDYVTANWDRWSGANVAQDGATGKVLYVDNDGAFYESPPADALARQLSMVARLRRFSRRFVDALRGLDRGKMREAFGDESPGVPLLPDGVVAAADERRTTALHAIDARLGDAGEGATLVF